MEDDTNASGLTFAALTGIKPLFELGLVVITKHCAATLEAQELSVLDSLIRHATGDWGDLDAEDIASNNKALVSGPGRLFSAYVLSRRVKVWIITEWDRSATTILLPEDY